MVLKKRKQPQSLTYKVWVENAGRGPGRGSDYYYSIRGKRKAAFLALSLEKGKRLNSVMVASKKGGERRFTKQEADKFREEAMRLKKNIKIPRRVR